MAFEALLLLVGVFLALATAFWRAANRTSGEQSASTAPQQQSRLGTVR
jgi:hypothetical protein